MRDFAAAGAIQRIYVHSPDRLARSYAYQVVLLDEWRRYGIEAVFLNKAIGQSPEDDLLLQVQGVVAEYERAKIMERCRRGKRHAARTGNVGVMSCAPYGYRYFSRGRNLLRVRTASQIHQFKPTGRHVLELAGLIPPEKVVLRSSAGERVALCSEHKLDDTICHEL